MIQSEKIQSINDPGWEGLDAVADNSKLGMEQRELNVAFATIFTTTDGKKVLQYLKRVTIDQPAWNPGSDHSVGYSREGQNSIIREIMYRIERAKNG
jgi:hypothetical protein|tara:strand:- start:243 stop:533 length:291 start_codon:yes stop_codon:yes gene_type:complete